MIINQASSSETRILDDDSLTASDPENFDQADQQDVAKSNELMQPSQPKLVAHVSPTNDGASYPERSMRAIIIKHMVKGA